MAEEVKGVEAKTDTAPVSQEGVEAKTSAAPHDDPEAKVAALEAELAAMARDRDNYRNATLALKGKKELEELDLTDPVQVQTFINKSIEERLLQDKVGAKENELMTTAKEQARKIKELTFALANKAPVASASAGGSGADAVPPPQVGYFSPEQKGQLESRWKALGIKEEKFPEMLKQAEENSKRSSIAVL